jgi:tRNA-uridine 2-sulfurtransferase
MSGGVDSSVAAALLKEQGYDVIGMMLRLWSEPGKEESNRCCTPDSMAQARRVAAKLDIPFYVIDAKDVFRETVVQYFLDGYARGETPNPCIQCNGGFRFGELLAFARKAGAGRLATGHYARIVERHGRLLLARAVDPDKDQSYMLAALDPRRLGRLWFPLGDQGKEETRAEAAGAGLAVAARAESQEACFLAGDDYRSFLERHGLEPGEGPVVDTAGRELGSHTGYWRFTPGQRKGIGVATGIPLYAVRTEPRTNTLVVGPREALACSEVRARGRLYAPVRRVEAKLRYRSPAIPCDVEPSARGFALRLERPAYGVAKGQAAVLYESDTVVGMGRVSATVSPS